LMLKVHPTQYLLNWLIFFFTAWTLTARECYTRFGYVHAQDALLFDPKIPPPQFFWTYWFFFSAPAWTARECYTRFGYEHAQDALLIVHVVDSPNLLLFASKVNKQDLGTDFLSICFSFNTVINCFDSAVWVAHALLSFVDTVVSISPACVRTSHQV
jgi:hypothetical protein